MRSAHHDHIAALDMTARNTTRNDLATVGLCPRRTLVGVSPLLLLGIILHNIMYLTNENLILKYIRNSSVKHFKE